MIEIPTQLMDKCPACGWKFVHFIPYGDEAIEQSKAYKFYQILKSKFWGVAKPRSVAQLNTYWACCKYVSIHVSDHDAVLSEKDVDFDVKTRVAKDNPSMIKRFKMISGIVYIEPISIAFPNMKHLEACGYFDKAFPLLGDMVDMTVEKLIATVKSKMKRRV